MAALATNTGTLADEFKTFYQRTLLETAEAKLVHDQFGEEYDLADGNGKTMEFRRWTALASATTPLTEGSPGGEGTFTYTAITVSISQYGAWVKGTDLVQLTTFDPMIDNIAEAQGAQAGRSLDEITRDILVAGTNVRFADGVANRAAVAVANKLDSDELVVAKTTLLVNLAEPVDGEMYGAIVHPHTEAGILRDPTIVNAANAGNKGGDMLFKGEIGRWMGIAFTRANNAKVFTGAGAGGINVYATLVFGKNAYGIVKLNGQRDIQHIFKPTNGADKSDPLNQIWTSGWKTTHAVKILQEPYMLRIEHSTGL